MLPGVVCAVLLLAATGCTSAPEASPPTPKQPTDNSRTAGTTTTLKPEPRPLEVSVTRVAGTLAKSSRASLQHNVGAVIETYFDHAFVGGRYPRADFGNAFSSFSRGAARMARSDRDLLTNRVLGPSTESVAAVEQKAYLSVLAPHRVAAGVTARISLELVADRGDRPDRRVRLTGRLLLSRDRSGGWQIFGYDVAQSAVPLGKGRTR